MVVHNDSVAENNETVQNNNEENSLITNNITSNGINYKRIMIKTHIITSDDDIVEVVDKYTKDLIQPDDIVFISEKATAASQGRAIPVKDIKPGFLAKFLSRFVMKTPAGIGLGMPETMEMAIREVGAFRVLIAAIIGGFAKIVFKKKGVFYKIAGPKAKSIDGPTPYTIPPYNEYVVLSPENPDETARKIAKKIGVRTCIVDINDLDQEVLGYSEDALRTMNIPDILRDNPFGQGHQQTPIGIIRKEA